MDVKNGLGVPEETLDAEVKSFFEFAPPLKNRDDISEKLKEFVERNSALPGKFTLELITYAIFMLNFQNGPSDQ